MPNYKDDPRWIRAKFPSMCAECGKPIRKHDEVFYYPRGKKVYCSDCGVVCERDFDSCVFDEAQYNGGY